MIVKSSLALSLGLVGALSIVRFRTPIKEPEDLIYLFLALAGHRVWSFTNIHYHKCFYSYSDNNLAFIEKGKYFSNNDYNLIVEVNNSKNL